MRRSSFEGRRVGCPPLPRGCMPLDEGHEGRSARNCESRHVLRATLVVVKGALIPILYLWIIPMHRQTQIANPRDVKPADLQSFSHE